MHAAHLVGLGKVCVWAGEGSLGGAVRVCGGGHRERHRERGVGARASGAGLQQGTAMGGNIFNGNINGRATAWMMIGMLVFAVIWESFTDWLEHKLHHNKAHSEILQKVYKELMILGFIAFGLIMGKEVGAVTWNAETLHCFEFCDLLVSICVLVYVANCAISSFTLHTVQRDWDRVALMPTTKVIKDAKSYLKKLEASPWMKFKACLPFSGTAWRKDADFKIMQLLFQLKFHMPPQFDYVMYLKLVLEGVVCSMANVTTWHWMIVMLINFVWWLGMVYVYPFLGFPEPPESDKICMALCDSPESRRRLAATAAPEVCRAQLFEDTCAWDGAGLDDAWQKLRSNDSDTSYWSQCAPCLEALRAGPPDITEKETLHSIIIYIAVGWSLVAIQGLIVTSLFRRIDKILAICDGDTDKIQNHEIPGLLTSLAAQVAAAEDDKRSLGDHNPLTERTDLKKKSVLHHTHLVQVEGEADEEETDTLMVFSEVGMTSNDIFSIKKYESLMFLTQMVQLVMDFYVGFYFVHVNQRVPKAFGVKSLTDSDYLDAQTQVLLHAAILSSAVSVVLLVVITTRKITILLGVLHLAEDPVSDVLTHVETVKALRNRIKDRLRTTALRQATPNPDEAQRVLDQLANGEKPLLERIGLSMAIQCLTVMSSLCSRSVDLDHHRASCRALTLDNVCCHLQMTRSGQTGSRVARLKLFSKRIKRTCRSQKRCLTSFLVARNIRHSFCCHLKSRPRL